MTGGGAAATTAAVPPPGADGLNPGRREARPVVPDRGRRGSAGSRQTGRLPRRLVVGILAAVLPAASLASCNLLDDDQPLPGTARVEITGSAPQPLELVVSDNFERVADFDQGARYTRVISADTSLVQPDFTREYDIGGTHRFYVRLTNHSSEVAQILLQVAFDGEVEYSQRANLSEGGALEFSEVFFGT